MTATIPERVEELKNAYRKRLQILAPETDFEYDVVLFGETLTTALTETDQQARERTLNGVLDVLVIPVNPSNDDQREWYRGLGREEQAREMREKVKALSNPPSQV